MRRASLALRSLRAACLVALTACGGRCDAPFHLSYFDERIAPTHEFVRSDGRQILFGEYEFDEFEDGGTVAAAWFGTLDEPGSHFGGISWMGDVWQRDDEGYLMLVNDDQAAPLLAELDRDARFVRVHVLDLTIDYGYPPDTHFELWGGDGSDEGGYLVYVPNRLARLRADLSTAWSMDLGANDRAAVAGERTFLARASGDAIVVDRIGADASSEAQVELSSSEVPLALVALTSVQNELVVALASTDGSDSIFLARLNAELELRYQLELPSYGARPGFVACFEDGRCAFSSWAEEERHISTLVVDSEGGIVTTLGYESRGELLRLRGRRDHLVADHALQQDGQPVGGPVLLREDDVEGCITSRFEPTFSFGERQLTVTPSEQPLTLRREELVRDGNSRYDDPEETDELPTPKTCE